MPVFSDYIEIWFASLTVIIVIMLIAFIMMIRRFGKLRNNYIDMLMGDETSNLEQVLIQLHNENERIHKQILTLQQEVEQLQCEKKLLKANIGVHRYNAYDQQGSDLSFSIAFVDEFSSGAVLTGLHSREQTYLYAKSLDEGHSPHPLSPEEKTAINLAVNKGKA